MGARRLVARNRVLMCGLLAVAVVWLVLYAQRRAAHQPNVDDYLYASTSRSIYRAFAAGPHAGISAVLHTGQTAPLIPLLSAPFTRIGGVEGSVAIELPLLLALLIGGYLLARRWTGRDAAAVIAVAATLMPAVLGWSVMLNFALAATVTSVWSLVSYLRSDGFQRWSWSIATGVAVALLSLSRTLAPVYVAPLVLVMAAHSVAGRRREQLRSAAPKMAVAAVVALALAGPWWAKSGRTAIHYLRSVGYAEGSVSVVNHVVHRVKWTTVDLGVVPRDALLVFGLVGLGVVVSRRRLGADAVAVIAWIVGCFVILATSSNAGTGFGLPLLYVGVIGVGVALTRLPLSALGMTAALAALVTVAGFVGEVSGGAGSALAGPVYRSFVVATGAPSTTRTDRIGQRVSAEIGQSPTVLARSDDLLNINGLVWDGNGTIDVLFPDFGHDATASAIGELAKARFLITGRSQGLFYGGVNQAALEDAARHSGFRLASNWTLAAGTSIRVWRR